MYPLKYLGHMHAMCIVHNLGRLSLLAILGQDGKISLFLPRMQTSIDFLPLPHL